MSSSAACQQGVRLGMPVHAAHALVKNLKVITRDENAEKRTLEQLAAWSIQFTPVVSLTDSHDLLLEIEGSLTLFGGVRALCQKVTTGLYSLGYQSQVAVAPTSLAACWLASVGQEAFVTDIAALAESVMQLPLQVLKLEEKRESTLLGMGLRSIGDCLRLPRDGLARRLGPGLTKELDQALGRTPDPRRSYVPPRQFSSHLLLPAEVTHVDALLFAVQRLVLELCGVLRGCSSGVRDVCLQLVHRVEVSTKVSLQLVTPTSDARHMTGLLQEKLHRVALVEPVREIILSSESFTPLASCGRDWINPEASTAENWHLMLERLRTRVGEDAVHGICQLAEHRPECSYRLCMPGDQVSPVSERGDTHVRPPWLLPEAIPLELRAGKPYLDGELVLESSRERIESGWWDGADASRDYFIVRNTKGARFWIYRQLHGEKRWFLHGVFD